MEGRILVVGSNCSDWVQFLPKFPVEDSDQRCTEHSWNRGGNGSNNATVLALLGADVEFFGTIADDHLKQFFLDDMDSYGINRKNCPILESVKGSVSSVICSLETGSRTIVHSKGTLPELSYAQFKQTVNLDTYNWIHLEGRNELEVVKMLQEISDYNNLKSDNDDENVPNYTRKKLPVSVEVEKRIETISILLPYADIAFIGKDYAMMKGALDPVSAAQLFSQQLTKGTLIICPWGEQGAAFTIANDPLNKVTKVDAFPPDKIIDSLGAGDTFNAAVIYALSRNVPIEESVRFGCRIAGAKLGFQGFRPIAQLTHVFNGP